MQVSGSCFLLPFSWRWFEWFDEGIRAYVTGMPKIILLLSLRLLKLMGIDVREIRLSSRVISLLPNYICGSKPML
jgi:hypothetical protein